MQLPIEERPGNVGLLVGSSEAGKSTIARQLRPDAVIAAQPGSDQALVNDLPTGMSIKEVVGLLGAVGLNFCRLAWLRPSASSPRAALVTASGSQSAQRPREQRSL
ncbi:hypothetical protein FXF51_44815 [Nonomuraea sp. PA05]|uniref:hypothetical protein n=1 Tax=Nonomuraea sp. PA05 TaxID=2604466 RepID=UPI0011D95ADC|nr:hypothetical protein [Nonomuraea sp. PA05]TYB56227.1 hypothetical protein FXF51_44815 [Nonomuraea sp. PA05]